MPVYALDHLFGKWLFTCLDIDYLQWDPIWVESCNAFLKEHTGIAGLSLSAFFIGGNLLAIGTSVMLYPIMKRVFARYLLKSALYSVSERDLVRLGKKALNDVRILRQAQDERMTS